RNRRSSRRSSRRLKRPTLASRPTRKHPRCRAPATRKASLRRRPSRKVARPLAVAVTGGIGAGKSEALAAFARHGAAVVSSDEIVHRLIREDDEVRRALLERFGERILDEAGQIDRTAVAEVVFGNPEELAWLEALLHP